MEGVDRGLIVAESAVAESVVAESAVPYRETEDVGRVFCPRFYFSTLKH